MLVDRQSCYRCGRYLPRGSLKYVVHLKVYADFDGSLSVPDEDLEGEMDRILEEIEWRNVKELEEEVYQEMAFLL
jgi:hypothetical protein